jgi:hypothetical protein
MRDNIRRFLLLANNICVTFLCNSSVVLRVKVAKGFALCNFMILRYFNGSFHRVNPRVSVELEWGRMRLAKEHHKDTGACRQN